MFKEQINSFVQAVYPEYCKPDLFEPYQQNIQKTESFFSKLLDIYNKTRQRFKERS